MEQEASESQARQPTGKTRFPALRDELSETKDTGKEQRETIYPRDRPKVGDIRFLDDGCFQASNLTGVQQQSNRIPTFLKLIYFRGLGHLEITRVISEKPPFPISRQGSSTKVLFLSQLAQAE